MRKRLIVIQFSIRLQLFQLRNYRIQISTRSFKITGTD